MQVDFYHLTAPLARVLPPIANRIVAGGGRLLIVSASEDQRIAIDRSLWDYAPDSFLPHAQAGRGDDSVQPILIAPDTLADNGARHIAIIDGQWRDDALGFDRVFHLFDDEHIREARLTWKALADANDVERRYWKQNDEGRWEQAA
ncbi:DNA polymerase III subunit chi [Sphingomonas sp. Leaf17]|uniref:DNA polymerase III subunit chi n=1 Tax=Sphingomonas sp. Leaf17 TaxID=1735683 RepID=UPI000700D6A6|nr:DNA polymerase III subunit chi [Sphingomonas sp. Leaf17]KQM65861.1 DNA polymerase III subunit chi [Sphingomonas sp. Leaf17]